MGWNDVVPPEIRIQREKTIDECQELVLEFFEGNEKKRDLWFDTPNPMLGRVSPYEMITLWREEKLLKWIKTSLEENKI